MQSLYLINKKHSIFNNKHREYFRTNLIKHKIPNKFYKFYKLYKTCFIYSKMLINKIYRLLLNNKTRNYFVYILIVQYWVIRKFFKFFRVLIESFMLNLWWYWQHNQSNYIYMLFWWMIVYRLVDSTIISSVQNFCGFITRYFKKVIFDNPIHI